MLRPWPRFVAIAALLLFALLPISGFAGCKSANPVATAATASPEHRAETVAFALFSSYVVVAEKAADLAENPQTPLEVRRALVRLHQTASPAVRRLRDAAQEVNALRLAIATGESTTEKLVNALAALDAAITRAAPLIDSLAVATRGAP